MPRDLLAERFLSLFTSSNRAVSIVGDLLEETPRRGRTSYALQVLRISLALSWRSIRSVPGTWIGLAVLGLAILAAVAGALFVASGLPWYPWNRAGDLEFYVRLTLAGVAAYALTGMILGRWVSRNGVNGVVALAALWIDIWLISTAARFVFFPESWAQHVAVMFAAPLLNLLPLLIGGAIGCRRRLVRNTVPRY